MPSLLTSKTGQVKCQGRIDAFSRVVSTNSGVDNLLRFPGQYFDSETGLHYNVFSDYDSEIGRYL